MNASNVNERSGDGEKKLILVVDDDAAVREALCQVLGDEGHEVAEAADGIEALDKLRRDPHRVCLVLLDLMMPNMNGWDFRAEQLRDPLIASVPVLIISAAPPHTETLTESLAAPILKKPLSLDVVLEHVARLC